jgi:hypothetical protein
MNYLKLTLLTGLFLVTISCKKKEETNTFTDKLTFGTSINYNDFTLNGEGTSFSVVPGNVAYRLESSEDFNGNPVKFVIKKDGIQYSNEIYSNNPKPSGHIFMTTLNYAQSGSYSVTAYIQKTSGDQTVASGTFQMQ